MLNIADSESQTMTSQLAETELGIASLKARQANESGSLASQTTEVASWSGSISVGSQYAKWRVVFFPSTGSGVYDGSPNSTESGLGVLAFLGFNFSVTPTYASTIGVSDPYGMYDESFFCARAESATKNFSTWIIALGVVRNFTNVTVTATVSSPTPGTCSISRIV